MAKKKSAGASINLDSFLDVLTCLQGILMLVIIATGIDAAQTKVLIPTPIERPASPRTPIYVECRNNLIYPLDAAEFARRTRLEMARIRQEAAGDESKLMQAMAGVRVMDDYYEVDLTYYLLGQLVIKPREDDERKKGYELDERSTFATKNFMVDLLKELNKETHRIVLIVRDDSFQVFKVAQRLAFLAQVELGVEIFDVREVLRFTPQGMLLTGS
jgi:biopolymer transport protein ExbD